MGPSDAEKQGAKASKQANANAKEGVSNLQKILEQFESDPLFAAIRPLIEQIASDPFTFNDQLKASLGNLGANQASQTQNAAQQRIGGVTERLGLGRSDAGGLGLAGLAGLQNQAQTLSGLQNVENLAAQQRVPDLNRAIASLFGYLQSADQPRRELALGQLGTLGGLSSLVGANAQLASQQSGPLDFLGGAFGAGAGALSGGLGLGLAGEIFPGILRT
mgnify:CR=1 FL=1